MVLMWCVVRFAVSLLLIAPRRVSGATWTCTARQSAQVAVGAVWTQSLCSSTAIPLWGAAGPLIVNVLDVDLTAPGVALVPLTSPVALLPLDAIAAAAAVAPKPIIALAGINAGYFYRVDDATFVDSVCQGKVRRDATLPAAASTPNTGIGDGSVVSQGVLVSNNCDLPGFSRPAILTLAGAASRIDVLHRGATPPAGTTRDSLAAGPNLVSFDSATGTSFVDVPADDDNLGNILEHAANAGVGFRIPADGSAAHAHLVTFDGYDGCPLLNSSCGTNAFVLADFFLSELHATFAMGMDQGGSTTFWLNSSGIVSSSGGGPRPLYSGLFLVATPVRGARE